MSGNVNIADTLGRFRSVPRFSYGSTDVVNAVDGLTYRQLDHWRRRHIITPSIIGGTGSGNHHRWSHRDLERLRALIALNLAMRQGNQAAPLELLAAVWKHLETHDTFELEGPHVSMCVRLYPEDARSAGAIL